MRWPWSADSRNPATTDEAMEMLMAKSETVRHQMQLAMREVDAYVSAVQAEVRRRRPNGEAVAK